MQEPKQGIGPWANLPASKDPASPHYLFQPEHERLSSLIPSAITTPPITPALPSFIAYWTGMYSMYGVTGRDSVYIVAMRRRAELIPRPFTQVEHAVLARYSQNMQNGAEYFGLLGLAGGIYWSLRTEYWPMEKSFRTMFGLKGGATGGETVPPSGFVYPNGWGQKEGGGSASTAGSATGSATGSAASSTAVNTGAPTGVPPESVGAKAPTPSSARFVINPLTVTEEMLRGPPITLPKPPTKYDYPVAALRKVYICQPFLNLQIRYAMYMKSRLEATPPELRNTEAYNRRFKAVENLFRAIIEEKGLFNLPRVRANIRKDFTRATQRARKEHPNTFEKEAKQVEAVLKEFKEFDGRLAEKKRIQRSLVTEAADKAAASASKSSTEGAAEASATEAAAKATTAGTSAAASEASAASSEASKIASEASKAASEASKAASESAHGAGPKPNGAPQPTGSFPSRPGQPGSGFPPGTVVYSYQINSTKPIRNAFRAGAWAFFGKYVIGTIGLMWLTSGSRQKEIADERLQEYNYDRMEYAKVRMKEAATRRGLPVPPSQPQRQEAPGSDEDQGASRRPERFEPVDTQSLGGVQSESIDWGDLLKDDAPAAQRQMSNDPALPPIRPGESAWDRARRAREGPQGPAMEEDRWAPQAQQDTAARTDDMANMSRWEKIRQQASEGYAGERRVPGEARDGGESSGSFGGFGRKQRGQDRQKTKEELQREFDAQVDKERNFEEGGWK
ncbi:hypothetical protein TWF281_011404 [Arthrobotrys megalospora]